MRTLNRSDNYSTWIFPVVVCFITAAFSQNNLTLSIDKAADTIRKDIYGALLEDWGRDIYGGLYVGTTSNIPNTNGMRNDIIRYLKEIDIGVLQFPGGCKAEVYHWKNGIGEKSSRPGGEKTNGMGTDEYFQLCQLVGCAPFIQVNCKEGTPSEMKAWLNYIHTNYPNKLKYLGIGNEPWGGCYAGISVSDYITKWYNPFIAAIPEDFNGKIVRVIAAGYTDQSTTDFSWTETVLKNAVGKAEGLSWHYYTTMSWTEGEKGSSINFTETDYYNILDRAYAMEKQAKRVMEIMDRFDPEGTIGLQPDEWGAWYDQIPNMGQSYQQSTVRDALITAQHFNFFNNNCKRIRMSQSAQPVNVIHSLFLTHPTSGALIKTPTFYVYKLYVPHHNSLLVPSTLTCGKVKNLNVLTASASIDGSGRLHISIANIHATSQQSLSITLNGGNYKDISGNIVTGPSITSYNDYNTDEKVNIQPFASSNYSLNVNTVNVNIPAHSVVMLELTPKQVSVNNRLSEKSDHKIGIRVLQGKRIELTHGYVRPTHVTISVFSINGKIVFPTSFSTLYPREYLIFSPEIQIKGKKLYIVKVIADRVRKFFWILI